MRITDRFNFELEGTNEEWFLENETQIISKKGVSIALCGDSFTLSKKEKTNNLNLISASTLLLEYVIFETLLEEKGGFYYEGYWYDNSGKANNANKLLKELKLKAIEKVLKQQEYKNLK